MLQILLSYVSNVVLMKGHNVCVQSCAEVPSQMITFKLWIDHDDYYFTCCIILKFLTLNLCYFQLFGKVIDSTWTNIWNVIYCNNDIPSCVLSVAVNFCCRRWLRRMDCVWPMSIVFFQLVSKICWRWELLHKISTNEYFQFTRSWRDLCKILIPMN